MEFLGIYLAQERATALESFPLCELMDDLQAIASKIYDMQPAEGPAAVYLETDLDDSPKDLCKTFRLTARCFATSQVIPKHIYITYTMTWNPTDPWKTLCFGGFGGLQNRGRWVLG